MRQKTISIVTPCFNEESNVRELYERTRAVMVSLGEYRYEHIFIDNASRDNTFGILKAIASADHNVKVIRNSRNFGHVRSPIHALYQAGGDAVIGIAADLQDPPEMMPQFVRLWEEGYPIVVAVKETSDENRLMFWIRKRYYGLVNRLSGVETYENVTGYGLYDRKVIDLVKEFNDPYPYFRGIIAEIGFKHAEIAFHQPTRKRGITKNNFYTLYDLAMLGITNLSKVPLRMVTLAGFVGAGLSILAGLTYLFYKLMFWNKFSVGIAPLVIGMFLMGFLQLVFVGIVGEYIGQIHTLVQRRPLVVEEQRVNFEYAPGEPLRASPSEAPSQPA
jgi:glycosyltransferase involved in cell wall biosynthesis